MTSMQMKSLIRNIAKEKDINAQIVLRNYMLERLLERISKSKFKDNFVKIKKKGTKLSQT